MEIFIEGKRLDVAKGDPSLLTFQLDDIKDFSSRNSTFSKTIVLPGTANNNRLFGNIFDVKVRNNYSASSDNVETNFNPSVAAECLIFQNRLQVFKGTLRVLEVVIDNGAIEYEVAVFGELGGLVSALGNGKLEDLDFSEYNQTWNISNVSGSWANTNATGVFYPLIDYAGTSSNKADWDIKAFRPALYVREYIDKIFDYANYDWECDLFNTTRFKNLIIPNTQERLSSFSSRAFNADADVCTGPCTYDGDDVTPVSLGFGTINTAGDFTASLSNTRFTYGGANQLSGSIKVVLNGTQITNTDVYFFVYKNGANFTSGTLTGDSISFGSGDFAIDFTIDGITFNNTDYFEIKAVVQSGSSPFSLTISSGSVTINTTAVTLVPLNYNEDIDINSILPRGILQRDFLSSIVKLFNLYIYEDKLYPKKLLIKPYVDFYDLNPSGVVDWNYKVDRSKPVRLKPMSELNSRYYNFNFKSDNDHYNEQYQKAYGKTFGSYEYDSQYEFAGDKTDVDIIFSPSPLIGYVGSDKIVVPMYKLESGIEKASGFNIRIMQKKLITGVSSYTIKNGVTTLLTTTEYPYAGNYDDPDAPANDIHFGVPAQLYFTLVSGAINVTQFNVYWSSYMAEITDKDSKLMNCYVKLDNSDIFSLDFSKPIYIDGSYWRLNKIEDWNASEPDVCKVELLKVINLDY